MNFAALPRWATPLPGESRATWLAATGRLQPMAARDWAAWVRAAPNEPERPFAAAVPWKGLPPELGDLRQIAPSWRLAPPQREVFCAHCHVVQDGVRRWPVRVAWLDARRLRCDVHGAWLAYREPPDTSSGTIDDAELERLLDWLEDWIADPVAAPESLWRRDLVCLVMRNWGVRHGYGAAVAVEWDLQAKRVDAPRWQSQQAPGLPSRLGHLPPLARIAVLLAAYRCWCVLEGDMDTRLVPVSAQGWSWLVQRWRTAVYPSAHAHWGFFGRAANRSCRFACLDWRILDGVRRMPPFNLRNDSRLS